MKNFNTFCVACALIFICTATVAQVKVGDNSNTIRSASLLELESTNKGLVFPRVSLSGTVTSPLPLAADILAGTVVYNTNAAFTGGVGLMVWTGTAWMAVSPTSLSSTDAWKLTGNSGTDSSINFLGTTDAQPLVFKVNNQKAGYIDSSTANTSLGYRALGVTTGFNNVAVGFEALKESTGYQNTATGAYALRVNLTGDDNTATGASALFKNTTGSKNVANGSLAMHYNITGNENIAIGHHSLLYNFSGHNNVALGASALYFNFASNNTATGYSSLYYNGIGTENVANGYYALHHNTASNNTATGSHSLVSNNTGNGNTAMGRNALAGNTTGNYNTAIGYNADVNSNGLTNATAIGYNAHVAISNAIVLGNGASVGIGVSSPTKAKLQIEGGLTNAINKNYRYMAVAGEGNNTVSENHLYSLYTSNRIWCNEEINVTSE